MAAKNSAHKKQKTTKGGNAGSAQQGHTPAQVAAKNHLKHVVKAKNASGHKKHKTAKAVHNSKTTKAKTHYSAAQRKAYQRASKAAIKAAQLKHNTKALQDRRLQAFHKVMAKLAVKRNQAIAARIKAHAIRSTYLQNVYGHQAAPLRIATAHRLFKAQSVATNRQFAAAGEAIHARTTTLQTLTTAQALKVEQRLSAKARASAALRKHKRLKTKKGKVVAKGKAATRKGRTGRSVYRGIGNRAGAAAAAKIKPARQSKRRGAPMHRSLTLAGTKWITNGNDQGKANCVAVAIANSLLYNFGYRVTGEQIDMIRHDRLNKGLWMLWSRTRWWPIELLGYCPQSPSLAEPGDIVGFEAETGPHCGVLMPDNMVISWGEIIPLPAPIDEAWSLKWRMTG